MTWPTISPAVRLRSTPMVPVKQKAQPKPQPTWVETHRVRRSSSGMSTAWIRAPSPSRSTSFSLPSWEGVRRSTSGKATSACSASFWRSSLGRSDMAAMSVAPLT